MCRSLKWLVALPLVVVGSQIAHGIAYWWVYPQASLRLAVLKHTGHGYEAYAPLVLGFLLALELLVFAVTVFDRVRGRSVRTLPAWVFLLLPVLGFTVQEHLERLLASGTFPWWTLHQPTFARGVVLQVALGVFAYVVAKALLRTAEVVAQFVREREVRPARVSRSVLRPRVTCSPRLAPLARAAAGRAPPS
jgi:hypothetical protein